MKPPKKHPAPDKRLRGESDREYTTRIEAQRVTLAWASRIQPPVPQESHESLPLFGGERQKELF
jgi:hypothetical protein